jgi:hypothetical protein
MATDKANPNTHTNATNPVFAVGDMGQTPDTMGTTFQGDPAMSDRDFIIALFNLVGAVAEQLTGKTPLLCVRREDGSFVHVYPDTSRVTWVSPKPGVSLSAADQPEQLAMSCLLHAPHDATEKELHIGPELKAMLGR